MSYPVARAAASVLLAAGGVPLAALGQTTDGADAPRLAPASTLAPVVVTATRTPEALADAIAQTTLFDSQDIADASSRDALGLIALAPGVQVTRNGGPGASSGV